MEIITALGNETTSKKIKELCVGNILDPDIQYQEAVFEILKKNKNINLLILSSILPGELNIYEFINIIKYKNPFLEIIIILEKEDEKLKQFIISKGINNIYYNNKITFNEISQKIYEIENKTNKPIYRKENTSKKMEKLKINLNKKIEKLIKIKGKKPIKKKPKIISIIGAPKTGKSIFSLILSLIIKNKKILLIDYDIEKNGLKKIVGKNPKKNNNITKWKNNVDIIFFSLNKNNSNYNKFLEEKLNKVLLQYDIVIIDMGQVTGKENILKKTDNIILMVEGNLLGISETRIILSNIVKQQKHQKDNIKIIYNKQSYTSISKSILDKMFSDFEILGQIKNSNFYNFFVNTNAKFITKKIKKEYLKIIKKII